MLRSSKNIRRLSITLYHKRRKVLLLIFGIWISLRLYRKLFLPAYIQPAMKWFIRHGRCYMNEQGIVWQAAPIMEIHRDCPAVPYETIVDNNNARICLTTLKNHASHSFLDKVLNECRNFDDVDTFQNHQSYAQQHGYTYRDTSNDVLDPSRPPAWSKIKAVQFMMKQQQQQQCDWVWWLDVDVVIMNGDIRLESLIPKDPNVHLVAAVDKTFSVNSGSWLIRNHKWSENFLETWWNMKSFVRTKGISLSGDNAAFSHLVDSLKDSGTIQILPRCRMNAFGVFLNQKEDQHSNNIIKEPWYLSDGYYHAGDFVAHAAGIDHKGEAVRILLNYSSIK